MNENGQIFDLTKPQKKLQKHLNYYKNTPFSVLCRRKSCILNAYAGVRSFCSSCNFDTKKTPFFQSVFFTDFRTAIQLHQHMLVQAVDKLAALAVVVDSSAVAVAVDKPVAAVQVVELVGLAEFAD